MRASLRILIIFIISIESFIIYDSILIIKEVQYDHPEKYPTIQDTKEELCASVECRNDPFCSTVICKEEDKSIIRKLKGIMANI